MSKNRLISPYAIIFAVSGVVAMAVSFILIYFGIFDTTFGILVPLMGYVFVVAVVVMIAVIRQAKRRVSDAIKSVFEVVTRDFLKRLDNPVVMCNEDGKIVWYNDAFFKKTGAKTHLYNGKYLDSVTDATVERILKDDDKKGTLVSFLVASESSIKYRVKGSMIKTEQGIFNFFIFTDNSEIDYLNKRLEDEDAIVSYITIDNLEDVAKTTGEAVDMIVMNITNDIRDYAAKYDGVLREIGRNRFLFIFSRKHLKSMVDGKFNLLDIVRYESHDISTPITISFGVADIHGTLVEKSNIAAQALENALQRGGDQVVIKEKDKLTYYGGKTRGISSGTTVRSRVIGNELITLIKNSKNVLVMGHKNADFDAIASSVGIARICKHFRVPVNVICDRDDKNLRGVFDKLGTKYETLFVSASEAQQLITSETLTVVCDVNNLSICEAPDVVNNSKHIAIIDHHRKTQDYTFEPDIQYIEPNVSSASELVTEFIIYLLPPKTLTKVEAELLFAGVSLDTRRLTHNAGTRTFAALQYLRECGADPVEVESLFRISLKELTNEAVYETNVVVYKSVVAIAYNENKDNSPLARVSAARAADKMLTVDGILASFALCKIGDSVHISARSTGRINVQLILESIGGGGHFDSAGAFIQNTTNESAMKSLRDAIDKYFEEDKNSKEGRVKND